MPLFDFPLGELASNIIDPVTKQVIKSFLMKLGVDGYFTDAQFIFNDRTAAGKADDGNGNINLVNNRVQITVDTIYDPAELPWPSVGVDNNLLAYGQSKRYATNYQTIFGDPQSQLSVQELTVPFGLNMSVKLIFQNYDAAQKTIMAIRNLSNGTAIVQQHDIVYDYATPMNFMSLLYVAWRLKKSSVAGDGKAFFNYMAAYSKAQFDFLVRKYDIGKSTQNRQYVIKKQQLGCQAIMELESAKPTPDVYEELATNWVLEFNYKIQFGLPSVLQVIVPPVVDNTPLPYTLFKSAPTSNYAAVQGALQTSSMNAILRNMKGGVPQSIVRNIHLPYYDDWLIPSDSIVRGFGFEPVFSGIMLTDGVSPSTMSLDAIDGVNLHEIVKMICADHGPSDILGLSGMYNISIFENNTRLDPGLLTWDPKTLTLGFSGSNIHSIYRVVLSEASALNRLDSKWYQTLIKYRYFYPMTIMRNFKTLQDLGFVTIDPGVGILKLIALANARDVFEKILRQMRVTGACGIEIYQYTATNEQFADYIANTPSKANPPPEPSMAVKYGSDLHSVFCDMCVQIGLIRRDQVPEKYIIKKNGYPYGVAHGDSNVFNVPLRVLTTEFGVQNPTG